jgi:hypothetical protein
VTRTLAYLEPLLVCRAKVPYSTAWEAHCARKRILRRRARKTHVYPCRFCHGFHLTTNKERRA